MKIRITVGEVELRLDGLELTSREVRALMRHTASIALAVDTPKDITVDIEEPRASLGFTAHLELDAGRHEPPSVPWWDDEE